ncbi:hypothetical protein F4859DRAFT_511548 [Xylaria cf. heliscus]|nr:hypothetical protein F4859DRAFT_511548 [Xylaria cf. heliscus]
MNRTKESDIRPTRRETRQSRSDECNNFNLDDYSYFMCPFCDHSFTTRDSCPFCPNCTKLLRPRYGVKASTLARRSRRQANARSAARSAQSNANEPVNRNTKAKSAMTLPSIRDIPILREALESKVPVAQDAGEQQAPSSQPYLSLRSSQEGLPEPPSRAMQTSQYDGGSEHQEQPVLPELRTLCSQSRTNQYTDLSGYTTSQGYHHYYDEEDYYDEY